MYSPHNAGFELLCISMHRTKQSGSVASAITGSHYVWDHIVYRKRVSMRGELSRRTAAAATTVDPIPGIFKRARNSWLHNAHLSTN